MISRGHRGTATGRPHTRTACIAPKGGGAEWGETQKRQSWNAAIERRKELKEVEFVPFSIEAGGVWGPAATRFFDLCAMSEAG